MNTYCYYHNDSDGKCSAAIIRKEYPKSILIPVNNTKLSDPGFSKLIHSDTVLLVDISLSPDVFRSLQNVTDNITWIDHHKSTEDALKIVEKDNECLDVVFSVGKGSACFLTWGFYNEEVKPPYAVNLISDYDEWKYKYGDRTMLFHIGSSMYDLNPESVLWDLLLDASSKSKRDCKMFIDTVCNAGFTVLRYQESKVRELLNHSFRVDLEGVKFVAINTDTNNIALRKMDLKKAGINSEGMLLFSRQKDKWVVTMYSDKGVDVSVIAKKYGGGGHRSAAGFVTSELPF